MPPKLANLKLPGLSHADSIVTTETIDSPRQTRSGRVVPSVPSTPRRAPLGAASMSGSQVEPSGSSSSKPLDRLAQGEQIATSNQGTGSSGQAQFSSSSAGLETRPLGIEASSSSATPASSGTAPAASLEHASMSSRDSFSRSRSEHSTIRRPETPGPSSHDKGKGRATESANGAESRIAGTTSGRMDRQIDSQPSGSGKSDATPEPAYLGGRDGGMSNAITSGGRSGESDRVIASQPPPTSQTSAQAETSTPGPAVLSGQRESTPIGGILWSEVETYLRTREGPPPKVLCLFCVKELVIEELQPPSADEEREPPKVLKCGHVFGEKCINRWVDERTFLDELDGPVSAECPICRAATSPEHRLPWDAPNEEASHVLGRRRRPADRVMQDVNEGLAAQPDTEDEQMPRGRAGLPERGRRERKEIVMRDPEKRNEQGECVEARAVLIGRLALRGKMAVELPSQSSRFPSCPRRYMLKCKDYRIGWGALPPLQKRDLAKLKSIARREREQTEGHWVPEVVGIISSPQYATEAQASPFHILLLRLPENDEWHSKSDAFAAFGNLANEMEEYWFRSGQKEPTKTRETHHREHLQQLGVQYGGEGALADVDTALSAVTATLLRQTLELDRERLAARRRARPVEAVERGPAEANEDVERGRSRTRRP